MVHWSRVFSRHSMTTILSIETSGDACSVSLIRGDHVTSLDAEEPRSHGRMLVPLIETLLRQEEAVISAVCVNQGPGSYTGLRIGLSTAKGLAWSLGIPLYAIPSLDLMAAACQERDNEGQVPPTVRCVMPARGTDVYTARYALHGTELTCLEPPGIQPLHDLLPLTASEGLTVSSVSLAQKLPADQSIKVHPPHSRHAAVLLRNPDHPYGVDDVSSLEPLYLREFEARRPAVSIFDRLPF